MKYSELLLKINSLKKKYKVRVIGKTYFNNKIFAVEKIADKLKPTAIFVASIHARENITTDLVFKMLEENLFDKINFNLAFILMANPDGVVVENETKKIPKKYQKNILKFNKGNLDFTMWKANARGVDLNNNFDANFGTNINSLEPSSQGFIGSKPFSEKETKIIKKYTLSKNVFLTISYHSKGEEIYYNFFQTGKILERDKKIAEKFAEITGYKIKNVESVSSGGYKDWCVQKLKIPALTIEVGSDCLSHPIKKEFLNQIYSKHKKIASALNFAYNEFIKYKEVISYEL